MSDPAHGMAAPDPARSTGFALLAVLFALLILTGVLHGTLMLARFQGFAGRAEARVLQARLAAQSGVRLVASDLDRADVEALAAGDTVLTRSVSLGEHMGSGVSVRRMAPEWYWIEAEGEAGMDSGRGTRRLAAVYWILEPHRRVEALRATVEVGGEIFTAGTTSVTPLVVGATDPGHAIGICGPSSDPGQPSMFGGSESEIERPPTAVLTGPAFSAPTSGLGSIPHLGLLDGEALALRAGGAGASGGGGGAATGGGGGASPGDPPPAFQVVSGAYTVPADGFSGLLALSGDLEVPSGRELAGLVLVGGSLTVRDGARVVGAARVGGSVTVEGEGTISGSSCTVLETLRDLSTLSGALPAPSGTWIDLP
ncbi:MAG: hypothetical protein ACOC5J_00030 [Gemmatimonadota bacterium]